jgi:hypothetical protein
MNNTFSKNKKLKELYSSILKKGTKSRTAESITLEEWELLKSSPSWCYRFSRSVYKKRTPELESVMLDNSPTFCYLYSRYVIKGAWPQAESTIAKNPATSVKYAKFVLENRFPKGEISITSVAVFQTKYLDFLRTVNK